MTKEELFKIREMIYTVQKKRSENSVIKAYQTTMDLELQKGETTFLNTMLEKLLFEKNSAAVIHEVAKDDYNFRNRMLHKCWLLMLNKEKISAVESFPLLFDPNVCPYNDILFFTISPEPGEKAVEGYVREQEVVKKLEELGFTKEEVKKEKNLFTIDMYQNPILSRKMSNEQN